MEKRYEQFAELIKQNDQLKWFGPNTLLGNRSNDYAGLKVFIDFINSTRLLHKREDKGLDFQSTGDNQICNSFIKYLEEKGKKPKTEYDKKLYPYLAGKAKQMLAQKAGKMNDGILLAYAFGISNLGLEAKPKIVITRNSVVSLLEDSFRKVRFEDSTMGPVIDKALGADTTIKGVEPGMDRLVNNVQKPEPKKKKKKSESRNSTSTSTSSFSQSLGEIKEEISVEDAPRKEVPRKEIVQKDTAPTTEVKSPAVMAPVPLEGAEVVVTAAGLAQPLAQPQESTVEEQTKEQSKNIKRQLIKTPEGHRKRVSRKGRKTKKGDKKRKPQLGKNKEYEQPKPQQRGKEKVEIPTRRRKPAPSGGKKLLTRVGGSTVVGSGIMWWLSSGTDAAATFIPFDILNFLF